MKNFLAAAAIMLGTTAVVNAGYVQRTNCETSPGHYSLGVTVVTGGQQHCVVVGQMGLTRAAALDAAKAAAWANATFGGVEQAILSPGNSEPGPDGIFGTADDVNDGPGF